MTDINGFTRDAYQNGFRVVLIVLLFVITGLLGFLASSFVDFKTEIATLKVELRTTTDELHRIAGSRYTASDAERDFNLRDTLILKLEKRVDRLETR